MPSSSQVSSAARYGFPCLIGPLPLQKSDTSHYCVQFARYGTWQLLDKHHKPLEADNLLQPLGLSKASNESTSSSISSNPPLQFTKVCLGESDDDRTIYSLSSPSMARNIIFETSEGPSRSHTSFETAPSCDSTSVGFVEGVISFDYNSNKGEGAEADSKDKSRAGLGEMMRDSLHQLRAPAGLLKEAATRSSIGRVYQRWKGDSAKS